MDGKNNNEQNIEVENEKFSISVDPSNPQSPFYLCSSDSPSNIISPMILNGDNYASWSGLIVNALKSKSKIGFVDRTITKAQKLSPEVYA